MTLPRMKPEAESSVNNGNENLTRFQPGGMVHGVSGEERGVGVPPGAGEVGSRIFGGFGTWFRGSGVPWFSGSAVPGFVRQVR
jgi:hypothetical protein